MRALRRRGFRRSPLLAPSPLPGFLYDLAGYVPAILRWACVSSGGHIVHSGVKCLDDPLALGPHGDPL